MVNYHQFGNDWWKKILHHSNSGSNRDNHSACCGYTATIFHVGSICSNISPYLQGLDEMWNYRKWHNSIAANNIPISPHLMGSYHYNVIIILTSRILYYYVMRSCKMDDAYTIKAASFIIMLCGAVG